MINPLSSTKYHQTKKSLEFNKISSNNPLQIKLQSKPQIRRKWIVCNGKACSQILGTVQANLSLVLLVNGKGSQRHIRLQLVITFLESAYKYKNEQDGLCLDVSDKELEEQMHIPNLLTTSHKPSMMSIGLIWGTFSDELKFHRKSN